MLQETPLWKASEKEQDNSQLRAFMRYASQRHGIPFANYAAIHQWSVERLEDFWGTVTAFFEIQFSHPYKKVVSPHTPFYRTQWFEGSTLSYAQHIERQFKDQRPALIYGGEKQTTVSISWNALFLRADEIKITLQKMGIQKGDVVAGYLRHHPDTIAAFLATNALGAIWSCCSPDFGPASVIQRFEQLSPKVLLAHQQYMHKGKKYDLKEKITAIHQQLSPAPQLLELDGSLDAWDFTTTEKRSLAPLPVPFDHPIWVLFSSGTTGQPKAITHRTGGMLLEQYKALVLHQEVVEGERFFWHTTTGWMMWNYALGALLCGATLALYDGAADLQKHWDFAQREKLHHFGHGAPFFNASSQSELHLNPKDFPALKTIGSTGAPLSKKSFAWLQQQFPKVHIISLSGGTDVCSAFLGGNRLLPVYAGFLQCAMLGAAVAAVDENGQKILHQKGELVLAQPMPCMPVYFMNDPEKKRYHAAYFERFDGVWTHGDWLEEQPEKGFRILGRADATLNRNGVRIGTAEIYHALQQSNAVLDSLMVDVEQNNDKSVLILFAVAKDNPSEQLNNTVLECIRQHCSARHLPDQIVWVAEVPYTLSGKKMELPVKKIVEGQTLDIDATKGLMRNPKSLDAFIDLKKCGGFRINQNP